MCHNFLPRPRSDVTPADWPGSAAINALFAFWYHGNPLVGHRSAQIRAAGGDGDDGGNFPSATRSSPPTRHDRSACIRGTTRRRYRRSPDRNVCCGWKVRHHRHRRLRLDLRAPVADERMP